MCEEDTFDFILLCFIFKYHCYYYEYMGIVMPLLYICNASLTPQWLPHKLVLNWSFHMNKFPFQTLIVTIIGTAKTIQGNGLFSTKSWYI